MITANKSRPISPILWMVFSNCIVLFSSTPHSFRRSIAPGRRCFFRYSLGTSEVAPGMAAAAPPDAAAALLSSSSKFIVAVAATGADPSSGKSIPDPYPACAINVSAKSAVKFNFLISVSLLF